MLKLSPYEEMGGGDTEGRVQSLIVEKKEQAYLMYLQFERYFDHVKQSSSLL